MALWDKNTKDVPSYLTDPNAAWNKLTDWDYLAKLRSQSYGDVDASLKSLGSGLSGNISGSWWGSGAGYTPQMGTSMMTSEVGPSMNRNIQQEYLQNQLSLENKAIDMAFKYGMFKENQSAEERINILGAIMKIIGTAAAFIIP